MTMTIGRCSLLEDPMSGSLDVNGNTISFTLREPATSVDDCKAKMQQLSGLLENNDESTFPITWTEDPTFDGFYMIRSLRISPLPVYLSTGFFEFSIVAERIGGGFARPQFESIVQTLVRTNSHAVTAPAGFDLSWYAGTSTESDVSFSAGIWNLLLAEGTQKWHTATAPSGPSSYYVSTKAADYYLNSARVEVQYGSTWYPVLGQQVPLATGVNWRIANANQRLTPTSVGGNGRFTLESWTAGDSLYVGKEFGIITAASTFVNATGTTSDASSLKIIKNSPEHVVVRVRQQAEAGAVFDFSLRKGDYWVEVNVYQPDGATTQTWGVQLSTGVAGTSSTGAVRTTAAASSRYYQITCPSTVTADTANTGLRLSAAAATAVFAVSANADIQGLGITAAQQRDLFLAARTERTRVVTR
jgi:hypothetical protein